MDTWKPTRVVIDEAIIAEGEVMKIIDPLWWAVSIYDGLDTYVADLARFSEPQRHVHAMTWYQAEVCNGGHCQFYSNSTGIVWKTALDGFEAAGIPEVASLIEESIRRVGSPPPFDRDARNAWLDEWIDREDGDFEDLDSTFYVLEEALEARILAYVRAHAGEFLFNGVVRKPPN